MRFVVRNVVGTIFLIAIICASALTAQGAAAKAASVQTYAATRGHITRAARVTPTAPGKLQANGNQTRDLPLLLRNGRKTASASATNTHAPVVPNTTVATKGQVIHAFDGVDAIQNRAVNGFNFEPPVEGLAAGNGFVFNLVNLAGVVYRTNGALVSGPFSLYQFFAEPVDANISNPRVFYDRTTHRWFASLLEYDTNDDGDVTDSHVDFAASVTSDPSQAWTIYRIPTANAGRANCPCLPDFPMLGIDQYNVYIATTEIIGHLDEAAPNGGDIIAISKSQAIAGGNVNFVQFAGLSIGGMLAYHLQPAMSYSAANAEYFMNSLDPHATFDTRIGVWALTNRQAVTTGNGLPLLSSVVIASEAYGFPVNAVTPPGMNAASGTPTSGLIAANDDGMFQVEYLDGTLVGALDTSVTIPGDTGVRDGVAWFQVKPSLSSGVISANTKVIHQGYLAAQGLYLLYPYISLAPDGTMGMVFSLGGPSTYLSAAYAIRKPGGSFGAIHVAAPGVTTDNGFTGTADRGGIGRWGDYSDGELDPATNRVWLATQYIPNQGTANANWGNFIFQVQL